MENKYVKTFESYLSEKLDDIQKDYKEYKLVFRNNSIDSAKTYKLFKETDKYVFLQDIIPLIKDQFYRVSKKTLKVYVYNNDYSFEMPTAIQLVELSPNNTIKKTIKEKNIEILNNTPELKEEFYDFTQYCLNEVGIDTIIDFLKIEDGMNFNLSSSVNFSKEEQQGDDEDIVSYVKRKSKNRYTWEQVAKRLKHYYFIKMVNEIPKDKEFQSEEEAGKFLKIYTQKFIYGYLVPMAQKRK